MSKKRISDEGKANRTLFHGMKVLEILSMDPQEQSIKNLSTELSLPESHVHRLLKTLVEMGYVSHSPRTRKYSVDLSVFKLTSALNYDSPLIFNSGPYLKELSHVTGGSAFLEVWRMNSCMTVASEVPRDLENHFFAKQLQQVDVLSSSGGRLFVSLLSLNPKNFSYRGSLEILERELDEIRKSRVSFVSDTNARPFVTASCPILAPDGGLLAAISVMIPKKIYRTDQKSSHLRILQSVSARFTEELKLTGRKSTRMSEIRIPDY